MSKNIEHLVDQNDELYEKNDEIIYKLETVSDDRVVNTKKKGDRHVFVIIKNNYSEDDESDDEDSDEELVVGTKTKYEYCAIRTMTKLLPQRLKNYRLKCPNMKIVIKINYSPNANALWRLIKEKMGKKSQKKMIVNGNNFDLHENYTEKKLIRDIRTIHDERLVNDIDDMVEV